MGILDAPVTAASLGAALKSEIGGPTETLRSAERHGRAYVASTPTIITPAVNAALQVTTLPLGLRYRLVGALTLGVASGAAFGASVATLGVGTAALVDFKGIGIDVGTNRPIAYDGGVVSLSTTALPAGSYMLMISVDELQISLVIRSYDGTTEFRRNLNKGVLTHFGTYWTATGPTMGKAGLNPSSATLNPRTAGIASSTPVYNEAWVDKSGWSAGTMPQVSAGKMYAGPAGLGYLERDIPVGYSTHTIDTTINNAGTGATTGIVLVGVDCGDTANAEMLAIGIDATSRLPMYWRGSAIGGSGTVNLSATAIAAGVATVKVQVTATDVIMTLTDSAAVVNTITVSRSTLATQPKQTRLWNTDSRQLTGSSIGSLTTTTNVTGSVDTYEGATASVIYLKPSNASTSRIRIELPKTYSSDKPAPVVIYCHGSGRDAASGQDDVQVRLLTAGLTNLGYIVVHSDAQGTTNWGNPASVADYVTAYQYVRDHYGISAVYLVGQSMGGLASLTIIGKKLIPGILGWFGVNPVTNLRSIYDKGQFNTYIEAAYGMSSGAPTWAAATAGSDPNLRPASDYSGVAYRVLTSVSDSVVPPADNSQLHMSKLASLVPESSIKTSPGTTHIGDESFDAADAHAFFKRCATY